MAYNSNAKDRAYDFIIDKIKNKEWSPDQKIWTEDVLVQEIGVSRVAVRNAVEKLVGMGILKKLQGSGTFVNTLDAIPLSNVSLVHISRADMVQILDLRKYIEPAAVEMFILHASDDDINELSRIYDEMVRCSEDEKKFYKADFEFHKKIANGSNNRFLISIQNMLVDIFEDHQKVLYSNIGPGIGIEYHENILKYIKMRDVELATLFMRKHIEAAIDALERK